MLKKLLLCFIALFIVQFNTIIYSQDTPVLNPGITNSTLTTGELKKASPEDVGMDAAVLAEMDTQITNSKPYITSVMVLRKGNIVFEKYYEGDDETLREIRSVTKSYISALIGIALKEGFITSIDQKVFEFFPKYTKSIQDPNVKEITIRHLLMMTSGIPYNLADGVDGYMEWRREDNLIKSALKSNLISQPGEKFNYNDRGVHILSGVISNSAKISTEKFASKYLFDKLKIKNFNWPTDYQGYNIGCAELTVCTKDMAKLGQLYLNKGKWKGEQIVPEAWVEESTHKQNKNGPQAPSGANYGYLWWVTNVKGYEAFYANGYGGQFIYVIPDLEIVTVITSKIDEHREMNKKIVSQYVIPAVK